MNQVYLAFKNMVLSGKLLVYSEPLPSGVNQVLNTGVKYEAAAQYRYFRPTEKGITAS